MEKFGGFIAIWEDVCTTPPHGRSPGCLVADSDNGSLKSPAKMSRKHRSCRRDFPVDGREEDEVEDVQVITAQDLRDLDRGCEEDDFRFLTNQFEGLSQISWSVANH